MRLTSLQRWALSLGSRRTQVRAETPTAVTSECKTRVGVKRRRSERGAFSQICRGFTTQVSITCSLACHNSQPMAPRARQQATVSQEARTGPSLHRWGRYAAERGKKKKEYSQKRCWCWIPGCGLVFKRLKVVCVCCVSPCRRRRRCAGWKQQSGIRRRRPENSFLLSGPWWELTGRRVSQRCLHLQTGGLGYGGVCARWTRLCQSQSSSKPRELFCFLLSATRCFYLGAGEMATTFSAACGESKGHLYSFHPNQSIACSS